MGISCLRCYCVDAPLWIKCSCTVLSPVVVFSLQSATTCPIRLCEQTAAWFEAFWLPMVSMRWVQWTFRSDYMLGWEVVMMIITFWGFFAWWGFFYLFCRLRTRKLMWTPIFTCSASQTGNILLFGSLKGVPFTCNPAKLGKKGCWSWVMWFWVFLLVFLLAFKVHTLGKIWRI